MKIRKVMIFTPTWVNNDGSLAMRPETEPSVEAQDFGGEIVREIGTHNPFGKQANRNVLAQYQRARKMFLETDCDALLTLEHDMAMPPDAVTKLAAAIEGGAGIAYGVYMLRHGSWVVNAWEYIGENGLGESLSVHPKKLEEARAAGVVRVSGVGWGCTMLSRPVVEEIEFHDGNGTNSAGDLPMAYDALFRGIRSVAVMDVACDHWDGELRLTPYGGGLMSGTIKVEALQDVVVMEGFGTLPLVTGEIYELSRGLATDLMRAAYVRVIEEDDAADKSTGSAANQAQDEREEPETGNEPETASIEVPERTVMAKGRRKKKGL